MSRRAIAEAPASARAWAMERPRPRAPLWVVSKEGEGKRGEGKGRRGGGVYIWGRERGGDVKGRCGKRRTMIEKKLPLFCSLSTNRMKIERKENIKERDGRQISNPYIYTPLNQPPHNEQPPSPSTSTSHPHLTHIQNTDKTSNLKQRTNNHKKPRNINNRTQHTP